MLRPLLSFLLSLFTSHTPLHLEVLFQKAAGEVIARSSPRRRASLSDRFFIGILTDLYDSWKEAQRIVQPETVIRWYRQSFRIFWKWKSGSTAWVLESYIHYYNTQGTHVGINEEHLNRGRSKSTGRLTG